MTSAIHGSWFMESTRVMDPTFQLTARLNVVEPLACLESLSQSEGPNGTQLDDDSGLGSAANNDSVGSGGPSCGSRRSPTTAGGCPLSVPTGMGVTPSAAP